MAKSTVKQKLIVVVAFCLVAIFIFCGMEQYARNGGPLYGPANDINSVKTADRLYLSSKDSGTCHTLTGEVLITIVFVDDAQSAWSEQDMESFKQGNAEATRKMHTQANEYGVYLNARLNYLRCSVNENIELTGSTRWVAKALAAAGLPSEWRVSDYLKQTYGVKEAPIMFAVNKTDRSFAYNGCPNSNDFEYAVLFNNLSDYRHELYHLFGAADYYYPQKVVDIVKRYYPDSIMMTGLPNSSVDAATAYLMGWQSTMTPEVEQFFGELKGVTHREIISGWEAETGKKAKFRISF